MRPKLVGCPGALFLVILSSFAFLPGDCVAHGGVSVEDDKCIMTIGPYKAHFTGYQPSVRASQEFCEDIPSVADSIIVIDFISRALREMQVDFRVVKDVKGIGVNAVYADLGNAAEIEAATVFYQEAEIFSRGSLDVALSFSDAGHFIGVLSATNNDGEGQPYLSVFPFSVGVTNWWSRLKWIVLSLVFGGLIFWWLSRSDNSQPASS